MSTPDNTKNGAESVAQERRSEDRTRDDADWESKVIGRLGGRLRKLPASSSADPQEGGWESSVLDTLRRRIERGPK